MTARPLKPSKDGNWAWFSKSATGRIREACDSHSFLKSALAVYSTFAECASNEGGSTFTIGKKKIAGMAGVSDRHMDEISKFLQAIGLLTWKENYILGTKERGHNTYTLLAATSGTPCATSGAKNTTPGTECATSGTSENSEVCADNKEKEESKEPPKKRVLLFPESLQSESFTVRWNEWTEYFIAKTGSRSKAALSFQAQLNTLSTLTEAEAIACINQSIASGWKGFFPQSKPKPNNPRNFGFAGNASDRGREYAERTAKLKDEGQEEVPF
jgi:hypothetical protein